MRVKCERCGKRRNQACKLALEIYTPGGDCVNEYDYEDVHLCRQCYFELLLPASLDKLLRRAIKGIAEARIKAERDAAIDRDSPCNRSGEAV